ncbi:uncharacterized protein LOC122854798 [Aphidius gifuensis]|uniref:uncharacterized protein LOC122854798 n=1 Tax=Aphidius gifuensis TaxID=684658 RepID=UPI001CDC7985|nr:uncharacterized protein LOC122854798 [Aphidius gifuensis]
MVAINSRNGKKPSRPARNVNLVVSAMRNLNDENGCTVGNIVGFISDLYDNPAPRREVVAALKRGVEFGIVDRKRGRFFLTDRNDAVVERNHGVSCSSMLGDMEPSDVIVNKSRRSMSKGRKRRGRSRSKRSSRRRRRSRKSGRRSKRARFTGPMPSFEQTDSNPEPAYKAPEAPSDESIESSIGEVEQTPSNHS